MKSRDYRHLSEAGITLAVDVRDGFARIALAACNTDDPFSPSTGRDTVDVLLDAKDPTLKAFGLRRNVVRFPYVKDKPRDHILRRVINFIADELGERVFFRKLHSLFMGGIVSQGIAATVAQQSSDETIYFKWKAVAELLDDEKVDLLAELETEQQFYEEFFNWQGSIDCIMHRLRRFANEVFTGAIVLEDTAPKTAGDRVAPRRPGPTNATKTEKTSEEIVVPEKRAVAASPVKPDSK